jgi:hypothetical protein
MEMLDVKAAIQLLDTYTSALEAQKTFLAGVRERVQPEDDPELATHVTSLIESLTKNFRRYAIFSIMLSEKIVKQCDLVLMHEDGLNLIPAQQRLVAKLGEIVRYLEECKQEQTPSESAGSNAASAQTTGSGVA